MKKPKLPFEDILCNIENSLRHLPPHEAKEIRQDCSKILRHVKPPKPNLSKLEFLALKNIKSNPDIVILKADKGNATVILNKVDYNLKMLDLLNTSTYRKIN